MFRQALRLSVLGASLAPFLVACGGGGDGDSTVMDMDSMPPPQDPGPAWPVDAEQVRTLTGAPAPDVADGEIPAELDRLVAAANSILATDIGVAHPAAGDIVVGVSCSGDTCESTSAEAQAFLGEALSLSLSDLDYTDEDAEYQGIATHRGVSVAQGRGPTTFAGVSVDRIGFGGWLEHSFFAVEGGHVTDGPPVAVGAQVGYGYSVGDAAGTNPATGGGTWRGVMTGLDVSATATRGSPILGDAEISIADLADPVVGIAFTGIRNLATGTSLADMTWSDLALVDGDFGAKPGGETSYIEGRFYGPGHEEVGGTFFRDDVIGAFGAGR